MKTQLIRYRKVKSTEKVRATDLQYTKDHAPNLTDEKIESCGCNSNDSVYIGKTPNELNFEYNHDNDFYRLRVRPVVVTPTPQNEHPQ